MGPEESVGLVELELEEGGDCILDLLPVMARNLPAQQLLAMLHLLAINVC